MKRGKPCACLLLLLFLLSVITEPAVAASGGMNMKGVSISGAEWGAQQFPGTFMVDYIFPLPSEIDYFAAKGMNIIRVPIMWERIQPTANGPLDPTYLSRLDAVVTYATARGMSTVIELHNQGAYYNVTVGVPGGLPNSAFANLWMQLATRYKFNNKAILSLMGEPLGPTMTAATWVVSTQAAIDAIRATGNTSLILVSAPYWNHARNFVELCGPDMLHVRDSANNFSFEVHEYFNFDGSGTTTDVVSAAEAVSNFTTFTAWLKANNRTGFLGEIGVPATPAGLAALDAVLKYLDANAAQWDGQTYWSAGPWWQGYVFGVEPINGQDTPQMTVLINNLTANNPTPAPTPTPAPIPKPAPKPHPSNSGYAYGHCGKRFVTHWFNTSNRRNTR